MASIKLYFRSCQLPEGVYQRLMEDRNSENLGKQLQQLYLTVLVNKACCPKVIVVYYLLIGRRLCVHIYG